MREIIAILMSIIFIALYCVMIYFMTGHGGKTIAGYHFEPTNEQAKKHHKYIMRRIGIFGFFLIGIIHTLTISGILKVMPLCYNMTALLPIYTVVGLLYFNKSKMIREAMKLEKELDKNITVDE